MRSQPSCASWKRCLFTAVLSLSCAQALAAQWTPLSACPAPSGTRDDYTELDNIEGPWVGLAAFPIRPMTLTPDTDLWAVNTQDSTLVHYTGTTADSNGPARMPWFPVSVAYWQHDPEDAEDYELLVVCRGSWTLARVDPATLQITGILALESEPGDILVDQAMDRAFVSCTGADSVLQIDLSTFTIQRRYHESTDSAFRLKSPLFLSFYQTPSTTPCVGDDDPTGCTTKKVLVAPLVSGNNTTSSGLSAGPVSGGAVLDLEALQTDATKRLPDEDLFVIDPEGASGAGTVAVAAKRLGTMLFQHAIHPSTGDFWLLNTEAHNRPNEFGGTSSSEPEVNGRFATNRITVLTPPFGAPTTTEGMTSPDPFIDLDPGSTDFTVTSANTIGQPFSLCFHPSNGNVFVCGAGSDNVMVLSSSGGYVKEWDLPTGSIPRQIMMSSSASAVLVYCWGDNIIRSYRWANTPPTALATFALGEDQAPDPVARGRKVFFSSKNSLNGNLSCATCHVDAGTDFLAWNLSNKPHDDKGPMVTQTLVGLERLAPFHWRGERLLEDFDKAFNDLLGLPGSGDGIDDDDFADMKAFLFSLKNPANPFQDKWREIVDEIEFEPSHVGETDLETDAENPQPFTAYVAANASAIAGQDAFRNDDTIFQGRFSCHQCHAQPTGTNNDMFIDESSQIGERTRFKVAPFHEEWRKEQTNLIVEYVISSTTHKDRRAFLGASGVSHAGLTPTVLHFINAITSAPVRDDLAAFIHQWDQGLAPAVHFAYLLDSSTSVSAAELELRCYLVNQARNRNCDIAVFGHTNSGVPSRWVWNRYLGTSGLFRSDNGALADRTINDFLSNASTESNVFIGLPVGMGERFAVDYDMDEDYNQSDTSPYVTAGVNTSDSTAPTFDLAPAAAPMWMTARDCRIRFDTDEPSTAQVRFIDPLSFVPDIVFTSDVLSKTHSVLVSGLRPSSENYGSAAVWTDELVNYEVEVTVTDRSANASSPTTLGGSTSSNFQTDLFTTDDDTPVSPAPNTDVMFTNEIMISSLTPTVNSASGGSLNATISAQLDYERGQPTSGGRIGAGNALMIGRVLVKTPGSTPPNSVVVNFTPQSGSFRTTTVETGGTKDIGCSGPFLLPATLSALSGTVGATSVSFSISGLSSGDEVYYSVEGVVLINDDTTVSPTIVAATRYATATGSGATCTSGTCTFDVPEGTKAFDRWDFPATKELNAMVLVHTEP